MYGDNQVLNNPSAQHNVHQNCRTCEKTGCFGERKAVSVPLSEDQLKSIFRRFDINRDGQFSRKELKHAFHSLGSKCPCWRAFLALHHADANGDGFINEDEISELLNYAIRLGYVMN